MTDPISFDPFLGWVDVTDPDNVPEDVRTITASDLLRYENLGVAAEDRINALITDVAGPPNAHTHAGADVALVTTTTQGAMSAADKVKLDGATSTVTVSRLVIRDADGRAEFMTPTEDYHAATKAYVDAVSLTQTDTGWLTVPLAGTWTHSTSFGSDGLKIRVKNGIAFLSGRIENVNAWIQGEVIATSISSINAAIDAPTNRAIGVACTVQLDDSILATTAGGPGALLLSASWPT